MTNEQIKEIALANGFRLKEQPDGEMDLNPYVYEFARALFVEQQRLWEKSERLLNFTKIGWRVTDD